MSKDWMVSCACVVSTIYTNLNSADLFSEVKLKAPALQTAHH